MLNCLHIKNLILVDEAHVSFSNGLNVLSGETGSGKSAIMEAIALVLGARADTKLVRKGAKKAVVDALFEIVDREEVVQFLELSGVDLDAGGELLIRREISAKGKSRAFVNHQMVQLGLLKRLGKLLIKFVGQHANHTLFSANHHRMILDRYGNLDEAVADFAKGWKRLGKLENEIKTIEANEAKRQREMEVCSKEIEEIQEADLHIGEEEELFSEYTKLSHADELKRLSYEITQTLTGHENNIVQSLRGLKVSLDRLVDLDQSLKELGESFQNYVIEIEELSYSLDRYQERIEANPARAEEVNERLSLIHRLQKKYGTSIELVFEYLAERERDLERLASVELQMESILEELSEQKRLCDEGAQNLTVHRQQVAEHLEKAVEEQLKKLNMGQSVFSIRVTKQKRSNAGDNVVEFYMAPNEGEHDVAIKQCASGGELSRVMLALQTLLAGKESIPSLVFDEVDAGIGGITASAVGDRLKEIGLCHQVICVTHFPQVAKLADHHLQILKTTKEGRTFTVVKKLSEDEREAELNRMVGDHPLAK